MYLWSQDYSYLESKYLGYLSVRGIATEFPLYILSVTRYWAYSMSFFLTCSIFVRCVHTNDFLWKHLKVSFCNPRFGLQRFFLLTSALKFTDQHQPISKQIRQIEISFESIRRVEGIFSYHNFYFWCDTKVMKSKLQSYVWRYFVDEPKKNSLCNAKPIDSFRFIAAIHAILCVNIWFIIWIKWENEFEWCLGNFFSVGEDT